MKRALVNIWLSWAFNEKITDSPKTDFSESWAHTHKICKSQVHKGASGTGFYWTHLDPFLACFDLFFGIFARFWPQLGLFWPCERLEISQDGFAPANLEGLEGFGGGPRLAVVLADFLKSQKNAFSLSQKSNLQTRYEAKTHRIDFCRHETRFGEHMAQLGL